MALFKGGIYKRFCRGPILQLKVTGLKRFMENKDEQ
jgi:hypothetical protein